MYLFFLRKIICILESALKALERKIKTIYVYRRRTKLDILGSIVWAEANMMNLSASSVNFLGADFIVL